MNEFPNNIFIQYSNLHSTSQHFYELHVDKGTEGLLKSLFPL